MNDNQELWYDTGYDEGHEAGREKARAEQDARWRAAVEELQSKVENVIKHYSASTEPVATALLKGQLKACRELLSRMEAQDA